MALTQTGGLRGITLLSLLAFLCTLLALSWLLDWTEATRKVDRLLHDSWVRSEQRPVPDEIVIAGIDPNSLEQLGRWPWSRDIQARLYERLGEFGARMVVADMLYTEASTRSEEDVRLIEAVRALPAVVLPVLTEGRSGAAAREKLPLPELSRSVLDLGHIQMPIDDDGIVRRLYLQAGYSAAHWPALALAAYTAAYPEAPGYGGDPDSIPGRNIPAPDIDDDAERLWIENKEVMIPFYGPRGTVPTLSVTDIIAGRVEPERLRDKIVFVGMTSVGLEDVVPTPVSALDQPMPGVEVHANVFAALSDGSLVTALPTRVNLVVALVLLPLMLLVYSRAGPQWGLLAAITGALMPILLSFLLYRFARLWYLPLGASVPVFVSYLLWSWHRLGFINRFLENESRDMDGQIASPYKRSNILLAEFFNNAARHMPIRGWSFSTRGQRYLGGEEVLALEENVPLDQWVQHGNIWSKRFPTHGKLEVRLMIDEPAMAEQITTYVDSLARIRSRIQPARLSGSIERLQNNALKLSDQISWLRSIKAFSESILDGSPAGFIVWNAAGEVVRVNPLLNRLLPQVGAKPLLMDFIAGIGRHPESGEDRERFHALVQEGGRWQVTYTAGETELVVGFNAVGDTMATRLICATVIDVSDMRTVERARAELVDYLSHDLRSPLNSAIYLLDDDDDDDPAQRAEKAERIKANIRRSLQMMEDLLSVARADSLDADQFDEMLFDDVVANAIDQLVPQSRQRRIKIELDDNGQDELWMRGDAALLERAVVNVLSNAIKYSPDNSQIHVSMAREGSDSGVSEVVLVISDQGMGIDPAMQEQLFTRFKRDARVVGKIKGVGLGLALVARVVQQHGGQVRAVSGVDQGTDIIMRLPLLDESDSRQFEHELRTPQIRAVS